MGSCPFVRVGERWGEMTGAQREELYRMQKEYRERRAEVIALLVRLWRLRHVREFGRPATGMEPENKWVELGAMVRRLIAEEEARQGK